MDDTTVTLRTSLGHTVVGVTQTWRPFNLIQKVGEGAFGDHDYTMSSHTWADAQREGIL